MFLSSSFGMDKEVMDGDNVSKLARVLTVISAAPPDDMHCRRSPVGTVPWALSVAMTGAALLTCCFNKGMALADADCLL